MVEPSTLLIIFVLLDLTFKRFGEALLIMAALPFALVGGIWLLYLLSSVAVILAGLFSIMWGTGTGSEVMQRIAAPMVGGMITAPLLSMFVIPAAYLLMRRPQAVKADRPAFWRWRRVAT